MKKYLGLIIFLLQLNFLFSQIINHEDVVKVNFSLEQKECEAFVVAKITIIPGWHINSYKLPKDSYAIPSEINITKTTKLTVKETIEPKPIQYIDEDLGDVQSYHKGSLTMKRRVLINSINDLKVSGVFSFQVCDEAGKCLMPHEYTFSLNAEGCEAIKSDSVVKIEKDTASQITNNKVVNNDPADKNIKKAPSKPAKSMFLIFIISFLSGFAALLTPCVFPMIPMTVSFFTKKSKSKADGIKNAILYGISIIAIYVLLGTIVTTIFGPSALNALSTNVWFNLLFFVLLVVFAISFLGAFEIMLPNSWLNKADKASDKGGFIGIFFMALALALVSFSCTGPIVGTLLVESATIGGIAPFVGMFGFSLALALPFALFAAFPGWMNSLPKSGGWLNTVKVFLGFLELALAFKFLSNADLVVQGHFLERELFLAIWIGIFSVLTIYLFGFLRLPHDSPIQNLSVGRTLIGTLSLIFVIYLIPGMWGAQLKLISGFPPPLSYSEAPQGFGNSQNTTEHSANKDMHLGPQNIMVFHDLEKAEAYAKEVKKPLFVDFTGHACVNCRKMEEKVWGEPGVIEILRDKMIIVSLYVDEKTALPVSEHKELEYAPGKKMKITQIGHKWSYLQTTRYKSNTQPYYRLLGPQNEDLDIGPADYEHHGNASDFKAWLEKGLEEYKKADTKN
ncbi:MAG: thiol:disulfide interchange protein [Flavobacteriia bacterium]|nr:thiol:disulfide interchange protein [Flavobacteriia bacterium]